MNFMHIALLLSIPYSTAIGAPIPSRIAAKVNGVPIYEEEIAKLTDSKDRNEALDRLILFHLAAEEAKKKDLDKEPFVQQEINKVLYKSFLDSIVKKMQLQIEPTDKEVSVSYSKRPLLRVRHLALLAKTTTQKEETKKSLLLIQKKLNEGVSFKSLILKYSEDETARTGGDLDFRGMHSLPPVFYNQLLLLKENTVSEPIWTNEGAHLLQWTERKSVSDAPATYLAFLRSLLKKERESNLLNSALSSLRKSAKIEVFQSTDAHE